MKVPVATRINDVRFKRMVRPGEKIVMEVELVERLADAFFLKAKVTVDGRWPCGLSSRVRQWLVASGQWPVVSVL